MRVVWNQVIHLVSRGIDLLFSAPISFAMSSIVMRNFFSVLSRRREGVFLDLELRSRKATPLSSTLR
jgi:hypothetical protein